MIVVVVAGDANGFVVDNGTRVLQIRVVHVLVADGDKDGDCTPHGEEVELGRKMMEILVLVHIPQGKYRISKVFLLHSYWC